MVKLNTDIDLWNMKEAFWKYLFPNKSFYFSRKENIWTMIYDHLFLKLYHRVKHFETDDLKEFEKSIKYWNSDYTILLEDTKNNINFSKRIFKVVNMYNIILYEIFITKLIKALLEVIHTNNLNDLLLKERHLWYTHNIWYNISIWKNWRKKIKLKNYLHYVDGWTDFSNQKKKLTNEYKYYIETDITDFYWSINHETLIWDLCSFFHRNNPDNVEYFMSYLGNVLFKANGYKNKGIPQWLISSDILSTIYLWLMIYMNKEKYNIKLKDWIYFIKKDKEKDIAFIYYWDDFIFFSDDYSKLSSFFYGQFRSILTQKDLKINELKTDKIKEAKQYAASYVIDFQKLINKDKKEITKYKNILIDLFKKNPLEKTKEIKTLFKWVKNIQYGKKQTFISFLRKFSEIFIDNYTREKNPQKRQEIISLFFFVLVSSCKGFVYIIEELNNLYKEESKGKNLENILYNIFSSNVSILWEMTILKLYLNIKESKKINYKKLIKLLEDILLSSNNMIINWFIEDKEKPLKKILKDSKLIWLSEILYNKKYIKNHSENVIGIKISSLFDLDITIFSEFKNYMWRDVKNEVISPETRIICNSILDSLIIIKNLFPNFYLYQPSFLADLYSLVNILLSILYSVKAKKIVDVIYNWWNDVGYVDIKKKKELLTNAFPELEEYVYLIYYIAKKRAVTNHKEKQEIENDIKHYIYTQYDSMDIFRNWVGRLIQKIFILINNYA